MVPSTPPPITTIRCVMRMPASIVIIQNMYSQLFNPSNASRGWRRPLNSQNGAVLELHEDGNMLRFPVVWLRDNCPCPECLDPVSGQKLKDITELPAGLAVRAAEETAQTVTVTYAP